MPAAITTGKMIAEPEKVSALIAVINTTIQTLFSLFSCKSQTAHIKIAGIAMFARIAFPS